MTAIETAISILVNNKPDVLARIAGTFSARGFNIESISANTTINPAITKIIITTKHSKEVIRNIEKQLIKLVDVLQVEDLSSTAALHREMLLIRLKPTAEAAVTLNKLIDGKGWKVVKEDNGNHTVEITGPQEEIEEAFSLLEPFNIDDYTRTGTIALGTRKMAR